MYVYTCVYKLSLPCRKVRFRIILNNREACNSPDTLDEGIEFSIHLSSSPHEWIPVKYVYYGLKTSSTPVRGFTLRGYSMDMIYKGQQNLAIAEVAVQFCNIDQNEYVQFRWLQTTVYSDRDYMRVRDVWILDDISIEINNKTVVGDSFSTSNLK